MKRIRRIGLILGLVMACTATAEARIWTDSTGKYTIDAELFAHDDTHVVLQRKDNELGMVPIDKLSEKDREYLKSKEVQEQVARNLGRAQTWTMRRGFKIKGKFVDYARVNVSVQRRRGKIYVNDRLYKNLPQIYQYMLPKIVAHFENMEDLDAKGFEEFVTKLLGKARTYNIEGVILEHENGNEYGVPFFFFAEKDLEVIKSGWDEWLAAHDDASKRETESFKLRSLAAAMQHERRANRQIAETQLNLQAIAAGVTSAWEVTLYPGPGTPGPPLWIVVTGRNSAQATATALRNSPGYVAGPVRRVSP